MDPIGGLVRGLKAFDFSNHSSALCGGFGFGQRDLRRTRDLGSPGFLRDSRAFIDRELSGHLKQAGFPAEIGLVLGVEVRGVEIVLSGDTDQGEEGVASGIGQRRSHSARRSGFANRADRPLG